MREPLRTNGAEPFGNAPADYAAEIAAELSKMKNLVIRQGIQFDGV